MFFGKSLFMMAMGRWVNDDNVLCFCSSGNRSDFVVRGTETTVVVFLGNECSLSRDFTTYSYVHPDIWVSR